MTLEINPTEFLVLNTSRFYYPFSAPSLDEIASRVYGMEYVGQQTDNCLPRGNYIFNFHGTEVVEEWCDDFDQHFPIWKAAHDAGAKYDFEIFRQAPGIGEVLADLIRRGELPYGKYLIGIDW